MDSEKFKQLLQQGKEAEARKMLEEFLASAISPQEQARALIGLASAYMEVENTLNAEYLAILKNTVAEIARLRKQKTTMTDAVDLVKTRKLLEEGQD